MDDEAKKIILARRARFIAATLATLGVATNACGGRSASVDGDGQGGRGAATTTGGSAGSVNSGGIGGNVCLSMPPMTGGYGAQPCLSAGGAGGTSGGSAGAGGVQVCLEMPVGGTSGTSGAGGEDGVGGEVGAAGEGDGGETGGGALGGTGGLAMPCLSPPR